jgi:hypothetical protein
MRIARAEGRLFLRVLEALRVVRLCDFAAVFFAPVVFFVADFAPLDFAADLGGFPLESPVCAAMGARASSAPSRLARSRAGSAAKQPGTKNLIASI